MSRAEARILPATQPWQVEQVRTLVLEYVDSLGIRLDFQDFDRELRQFPGDYAPPEGRLLLAMDGDGAAGCVGLRRLEPGICEMKLNPIAEALFFERKL